MTGRKRRPSDRDAFAQNIVDFVAQDRTTGAILALIELDDRTHKAERDRIRDAMTSQAGYCTVRIPAGTKLTLAAVEAVFAAALPPELTAFLNNRRHRCDDCHNSCERLSRPA